MYLSFLVFDQTNSNWTKSHSIQKSLSTASSRWFSTWKFNFISTWTQLERFLRRKLHRRELRFIIISQVLTRRWWEIRIDSGRFWRKFSTWRLNLKIQLERFNPRFNLKIQLDHYLFFPSLLVSHFQVDFISRQLQLEFNLNTFNLNSTWKGIWCRHLADWSKMQLSKKSFFNLKWRQLLKLNLSWKFPSAQLDLEWHKRKLQIYLPDLHKVIFKLKFSS